MHIVSEDFEAWMMRLLDRLDALDKKVERLGKQRDCLDGDTLLDNYDLCQLLKVCHRTLQRYRSSGKLPYYHIQGRVHYKASEVHAFIRKHAK